MKVRVRAHLFGCAFGFCLPASRAHVRWFTRAFAGCDSAGAPSLPARSPGVPSPQLPPEVVEKLAALRADAERLKGLVKAWKVQISDPAAQRPLKVLLLRVVAAAVCSDCPFLAPGESTGPTPGYEPQRVRSRPDGLP